MEDVKNENKVIKCDSLTEEERIQINKQKKGNSESNSLHTGYVTFVNKWGATMSEITIRHRRGNDKDCEESITYHNLGEGKKTPQMEFAYQTGLFSSFDYWWIKFTVVGNKYSIKDNFYCSVASDDNGYVTLTADGSNSELNVEFDISNGCVVSINKM